MCVFKCVLTCVPSVYEGSDQWTNRPKDQRTRGSRQRAKSSPGSVHDMVNRRLELRPQFARYGRKPEAAEAVANDEM